MILNKKIIQEEVEKSLILGKCTEGLGKVILLFAEVSVYKKGLNYNFTEFEVEYIIKTNIVDMLLLKALRYKKDIASAYTFFSLITSSAIAKAIKDVYKDRRGMSGNLFYIEDISKEISDMREDEFEQSLSNVYLDNDIIKLR